MTPSDGNPIVDALAKNVQSRLTPSGNTEGVFLL